METVAVIFTLFFVMNGNSDGNQGIWQMMDMPNKKACEQALMVLQTEAKHRDRWAGFYGYCIPRG